MAFFFLSFPYSHETSVISHENTLLETLAAPIELLAISYWCYILITTDLFLRHIVQFNYMIS